jgi:hypothetical protein
MDPQQLATLFGEISSLSARVDYAQGPSVIHTSDLRDVQASVMRDIMVYGYARVCGQPLEETIKKKL